MRNRSDDEAFDLYFENDNRIWKFTVMYGILTGFYWLFVAAGNIAVLCAPFFYRQSFWSFDRASRAFLQAYNWKYQPLIRLEAVLAIALHAGIVWTLHIPVLHYCALYAAFGFLWSAMQYVHHYGTERDVLHGARNLWLSRRWPPLSGNCGCTRISQPGHCNAQLRLAATERRNHRRMVGSSCV